MAFSEASCTRTFFDTEDSIRNVSWQRKSSKICYTRVMETVFLFLEMEKSLSGKYSFTILK